ncbi:vitamin K-dependent protein C [Eucyclogobius newberryi]|uniref:vitamin K-dependent protein C n=1 Tax=Eucyclogobius newberryi TaxID=166745 RepID=UPI003B5BC743
MMPRLLLYVLLSCSIWTVSVLSLSVFSDARSAHSLLRTRRANSFLEELKPANLERECVEEKCDFEEAREIFLTRESTLEFWTVYTDGNQCRSNLCVHGTCVDLFRAYACRCDSGFEGFYCDQPQTNSNCSVDNGGCDHNCDESEDGMSRRCSCVDGYRLQEDHKKCKPTGRSSCGQLLISRSSYSERVTGLQPWVIGGEVGKKGESPWQVMVLNARGMMHCGGVLIDQNWVLTAAHCLDKIHRFRVRLGDYERLRDENSEVVLRVVKAFKHPKYDSNTVAHDIALLRLEGPASLSNYILPVCLPRPDMAQRVLHRNGTLTVVTGWGKEDIRSSRHSTTLNVIKIPLVERSVCSQFMSNNITENVLCAGVLGKPYDACEGDSGGPMVTLYRDTWFLVGLVSWGEEGCGREDKLGVYTKVSNYKQWMDEVRQEWERTHHQQSA